MTQYGLDRMFILFYVDRPSLLDVTGLSGDIKRVLARYLPRLLTMSGLDPFQ